MLLATLLPLVWAVGTPVGTVITNQATVDYQRAGSPGEAVSNPVDTVVNPVCRLSVTPNGSASAPAHSVISHSGEIIYLPYLVVNTGNTASDFLLEELLLPSSSLTPKQLSLVRDLDGSGAPDPGELAIAEPTTLIADESVQVLLAVTIGETLAAGELFVNLLGRCADDPGSRDDDNVSQVIVPLGGISAPQKSADPVAGEFLYPDARVTYRISFGVNQRDLTDVVVSDTLDAFLSDPAEFSNGIITDPGSGLSARALASYDPDSRTVTWRFATIPAGMAVNLEVVTSVRADVGDIGENTVIDNIAVVESDAVPATPTDPVSHPLRPILITLDKTAAPEEVRIGDDLRYSLTVTNPRDSVDVDALILSDRLPPQVRYRPGTSLLEGADGETVAVEPSSDGGTLSWELPGLASGEQLEVTFTVTVLPEALGSDEIVNTAIVEARDGDGRTVADASAAATTRVDPQVFEGAPVLLGTVFIDHDLDGRYDSSRDEPLEGVRLYLSDGSSTVSDAAGRYSFTNLRAALVALRVDTTTAPPRYFERTLRDDESGLWRIRLKPGVITRLDVPFEPHRAALEVAQTLTVQMGPVTVTKGVAVEAGQLQVQLRVHSGERLQDLTIRDVLPDGAGAERPEFLLGDVPAGFETVLRYPVRFEGVPAALLLPPEIRWRLR